MVAACTHVHAVPTACLCIHTPSIAHCCGHHQTLHMHEQTKKGSDKMADRYGCNMYTFMYWQIAMLTRALHGTCPPHLLLYLAVEPFYKGHCCPNYRAAYKSTSLGTPLRLYWTASWVPMESSIERFHCIPDSQLGPNGVLYREVPLYTGPLAGSQWSPL